MSLALESFPLIIGAVFMGFRSGDLCFLLLALSYTALDTGAPRSEKRPFGRTGGPFKLTCPHKYYLCYII